MLTWLFLSKEVKPTPDSEIIKIPPQTRMYDVLTQIHVFPPKWRWFMRSLSIEKGHDHYLLKELSKMLIFYLLIFLLIMIT